MSDSFPREEGDGMLGQFLLSIFQRWEELNVRNSKGYFSRCQYVTLRRNPVVCVYFREHTS